MKKVKWKNLLPLDAVAVLPVCAGGRPMLAIYFIKAIVP